MQTTQGWCRNWCQRMRNKYTAPKTSGRVILTLLKLIQNSNGASHITLPKMFQIQGPHGQGSASKVGDIPNCEEVWAHIQKQRNRIRQRQATLQDMNELHLCFYSEEQEIESTVCYQIRSLVYYFCDLQYIKGDYEIKYQYS